MAKVKHNRLRAYVRRTIVDRARDYAGGKRRSRESTCSACRDAMQGTDTGWWPELIYTKQMLQMAHRYRRDIIRALEEYYDATGESYVYRHRGGLPPDITAYQIAASLMRDRPWTMAEYNESPLADAALLGLRFAVEWYAGEVARELCPDV